MLRWGPLGPSPIFNEYMDMEVVLYTTLRMYCIYRRETIMWRQVLVVCIPSFSVYLTLKGH